MFIRKINTFLFVEKNLEEIRIFFSVEEVTMEFLLIELFRI